MLRYGTILLSAIAGALFARERRRRVNMQRFGAATLETLLDAIDANSPETGAHVRRVASYSLILADAADLGEEECHEIERIALFHDIGKLDGAVSDIVAISKKLTPAEMKSIRTHPQRGADVLRPLDPFYPKLSEGVLAHHERWDGTGYPRGLKQLEIPLTARVVAIADTFDAMTHARHYSHAKSLEAAADVIARGREKQFDPELVDLFLSPPVLEEIARAMRSAHSPRRRGDKPRNPNARHFAPDIKFRWRTQVHAQRREDR